jgi:hypothetical protein
MMSLLQIMRSAHHVAVCELEMHECILCQAYLMDTPEDVGNRTMELANHLNNLYAMGDRFAHLDPECPTCHALRLFDPEVAAQ